MVRPRDHVLLASWQKAVKAVQRACQIGNVQRTIPHFLELLVANWRSMVENVNGSRAIHTCITPAKIQLRVGREMTNALAHERPKTYQYQRLQCAYREYDWDGRQHR
jgi:hypothetical protein